MIPLLLVTGLLTPAVAGATASRNNNYVIAVALQESPQTPQQQPQPQAEPQQKPEEPRGQINVDIDTHRSSSVWWTNPLWIGLGVVALIAVIAVIVAASRGGGTTVVRG
jgi:hypothetical protein